MKIILLISNTVFSKYNNYRRLAINRKACIYSNRNRQRVVLWGLFKLNRISHSHIWLTYINIIYFFKLHTVTCLWRTIIDYLGANIRYVSTTHLHKCIFTYLFHTNTSWQLIFSKCISFESTVLGGEFYILLIIISTMIQPDVRYIRLFKTAYRHHKRLIKCNLTDYNVKCTFLIH